MMNLRTVIGILQLLVFVFGAQDAWTADWTLYATSAQGYMHYDESSIKKINQDLSHVCTKITFTEHQKKETFSMLQGSGKAPEDPQILSHALVLYEIDCVHAKIKDFCTIIYDQNGSVIYLSTRSRMGDKQGLPAQAVHDKLRHIVCQTSYTSTASAPVASGESIIAAPSDNGQSLIRKPGDKHQSLSPSETEVRQLVAKWLEDWQAGDMNAYRNCYASDFESKGKNLDAWILYKSGIKQKSKSIKIRIERLRISVNDNQATAIFTQYYSSSIYKDSGQKKLQLKKEDHEWKIYREIM